ncbi:MAG: hypothetical protein ACSLFQ_18630 [Thermoanaerobaculia bacterium]
MKKAIPVLLAMLAVAGCMTSYPLWEPPSEQSVQQSAPPEKVTFSGRIVEIDLDESTFEVDPNVEGSDVLVRVEFDEDTVVYTNGARDEVAEGTEGFEMLDEDDQVRVSGLKTDDGVLAREVSLVGNEVSSAPVRPRTEPAFQPRDRVRGIVRSIDTSLGRIVLETATYGMVAFYCDGDTPVFYLGGIFRLSNLEVGDSVTLTIGATDAGDPAAPWVTAIEVTSSVSHDGPAPPAKGSIVPVPPANLLLDAIELEGTVKRVEVQGFEIEVEAGELRYVTADPQLMVAGAKAARAGDMQPGVRVRVRVFEIGERLVAQRITMLD